MDRMQQNAHKLLNFLKKNGKSISPLLILTHDFPDPDALAGASALQYLAKKRFGIESKIKYGGIIGRMENQEMVRILKIRAFRLQASDLERFRHIALIDTQPSFMNNPFPKGRRATLVIDQHHKSVHPKADLVLIDTHCGATCAILAEALILAKLKIPPRLATALVYGIISDTLNLYRVKNSKVIEIYLHLLARSNMQKLSSIENPRRSHQFFMTLLKGIRDSIKAEHLILSHLGKVESPDLVAQIADFLLTYRNMHWSCCTGHFRGRLHVSLRTDKHNISCGEVLRDVFVDRGLAGGHDTIAGGSMWVGTTATQKQWAKAEEDIIRRLFRKLRVSQNQKIAPFNKRRAKP